jgi:glutamyl-tRNA synthetase
MQYPKGAPPLGAMVASQLTASSVRFLESADVKSVQVVFDDTGEQLEGLASALRYVARVGSGGNGLYGKNALEACQIDSLVEFVESQCQPGPSFDAACASLNMYLSCRTYLVGRELSIADLGVWQQLASNSQGRRARNVYPHLDRWCSNIDSHPVVAEIFEKHADAKSKATKKKKTQDQSKNVKGDSGDPFAIKLPNAVDGKVVTRFPPEPSGYLHIGHAKAALLNQEIADRYHGRLLMRFDDTNPSKEKHEYVDSIIADTRTLGLKYEKITYTSDYIPEIQDLAERMIKAGMLYADDTPVEQMRDERMHGIESQRRNRSIDENMTIWKDMLAGTEVGFANCLRVKMDMSNPNKALRDPVCYRCNATPHQRHGEKYKAYPTYDFACPFVDSYEGVTHALRTSEYKDREEQFYRMLKLQQQVWPGLNDVVIWDYARLSFMYTVLSKRKLTWFVEQGIVSGWDDPRMPTVQGIIRRGLQVPALREFMLSQGASKNITLQSWDKIWTMNKKLIDPVCPRHTGIEARDAVRVTLSGVQEERVEVPKHVKNPDVGMKTQIRTSTILIDQIDAILLEAGMEITLMAWGNCIIEKVRKSADGTKVEGVEARLHLEGDFKKTKLKLTWLADTQENVPITLKHFGYLLKKTKLEEDEEFEDFVNRNSERTILALGDLNMKTLPVGEVIQLERRGYYIVDRDAASPEGLVLLDIPDGKHKELIM